MLGLSHVSHCPATSKNETHFKSGQKWLKHMFTSLLNLWCTSETSILHAEINIFDYNILNLDAEQAYASTLASIEDLHAVIKM